MQKTEIGVLVIDHIDLDVGLIHELLMKHQTVLIVSDFQIKEIQKDILLANIAKDLIITRPNVLKTIIFHEKSEKNYGPQTKWKNQLKTNQNKKNFLKRKGKLHFSKQKH